MQEQIRLANDERLRLEGAKVLGDRLVAHAQAQKPQWPPPFYDSYYAVLTEYLEEINYGGASMPAPTVAPSPPSTVPAVIPGETASVVPTGTRTLKERLASLKELLGDELITQDEHDERRKAILAEV